MNRRKAMAGLVRVFVLAFLMLSVAPPSYADSVGTVVHVHATGEDEDGNEFDVSLTCYLYGERFAFGTFMISTLTVNRDNPHYGMLVMTPYAFGSINEAVLNADGTISIAGDGVSVEHGRRPFTLEINRRVVDRIGAVTYWEPESGVPALHLTLFRGDIELRSCGQRF